MEENKMEKYKVIAIGWDKGIEDFPIILLNKKNREKLKSDVGHVLKIAHKDKKTLCIVNLSFKDNIKKGGVHLNKKTSELLGATIGDTVNVSREVTETECDNFRLSIARLGVRRFMEMISTQ